MEGMRQNDMSVYLGIDEWGVVEGGWKFLVMVYIEGGKFLFFVFFLLYVCMIDNSITFFWSGGTVDHRWMVFTIKE